MPIIRPINIQKPFAETGAKNTIPVAATGTGKASYTDGFPPPTMLPISGGGVPPEGKDFNGIFYSITTHTLWVNAGGQYQFDSALSTAIGGYPIGMVLQSNDGLRSYVSAVNSNTIDFNSTPSSIGVQWLPYSGNAFWNKAVTTTGGNTTLTATDATAMFITVSGTLVSNATITLPAARGRWTVINNTTGAFTLTVLPLAGTGVTIFQGKADTVYCDGTNIDYQIHSSQTRARFDNTTHVATTAFVQDALLTITVPPLPYFGGTLLTAASGNFTVPAGISKIYAYAIGKGADGTNGGNGVQLLVGSGGNGGAGGAGGAGGGAAWGEINVTPGQVIPYTIGASTTFSTFLTATGGVGRITPGTGSIGSGVTNSGTASGGNGALGANAGKSNANYPLSGGGGGGGSSGSPLGVGKAGASGGINDHPTYQAFFAGGGGWNTAGSGGSPGNATAIYRGAFKFYTDLLLKPCASIVTGEDGAPLGYGGGGGWMGGGGLGGGSDAGGGSNICNGSVGLVGGYGGGGGGGAGASMDGTTSGATKTGLAGAAGGAGCIVIFY